MMVHTLRALTMAARHRSKTVSASEKSIGTNCSITPSFARVCTQLSGPSKTTDLTPNSFACQQSTHMHTQTDHYLYVGVTQQQRQTHTRAYHTQGISDIMPPRGMQSTVQAHHTQLLMIHTAFGAGSFERACRGEQVSHLIEYKLFAGVACCDKHDNRATQQVPPKPEAIHTATVQFLLHRQEVEDH